MRQGSDGPELNGTPIGEADLRRFIEGRDGYMVCEFVDQHAEMSKLYPHATNTLRILTMRDETCEAFIAATVVRIGTKHSEPTDNWSQGALCAKVDTESGRLGKAASYPAYRDRMEWHQVHPETEMPIEGFVIPGWNRIKRGIIEVMKALPVLKYVGWDIAVTDNGFRIIEGNNYPHTRVLQIHEPLLADPRVKDFYKRHRVL